MDKIEQWFAEEFNNQDYENQFRLIRPGDSLSRKINETEVAILAWWDGKEDQQAACILLYPEITEESLRSRWKISKELLLERMNKGV